MQLKASCSFNKFVANDQVFQSGAIRPRCVYHPKQLHYNLGFKQIGDARFRPVLNDSKLNGPEGSNYLDVIKRVTQSGKPNCDSVRIPLYSTLDIEAWNKYLPLHNDGRLIEFLNYDFPLGVQGSVLVKNHPLALAFPTHVSEFLRKEVQLGAMLGPLDDIPFQQCHCSPLMGRPKDGNDRRIIVDLSFGGEGSVNGCTLRGIYEPKLYTYPAIVRLPT